MNVGLLQMKVRREGKRCGNRSDSSYWAIRHYQRFTWNISDDPVVVQNYSPEFVWNTNKHRYSKVKVNNYKALHYYNN